MKKGLLLCLSSLMALCAVGMSDDKVVVNADDEKTILVGEATTYEEKVKVAARELKLNIDEAHVVTTLNLPMKGLYSSSIEWVSSDTTVLTIDTSTAQGLVTRSSEDKNVTLTAKLTIKDNKDNLYTAERVFNLTILKKASEGEVSETQTIEEDFTSYSLYDDLSSYLRWDLTSGDGEATIVPSVPNNNMLSSNNALRIASKKTANETKFVRNFHLEGNVAFEGYMMYTGDINGIYFDLGRNDVYGPSIGIKGDSYSYYSNGDRLVSKDVACPTEGVWTKFRLEVNSSFRSYKAFIYKMDGSNETICVSGNSSVAYAGNQKFLSQLRIRIAGGSKVGNVYTSQLKVLPLSELSINEGENPNREDGIGEIENFESSVLLLNGETNPYESGFVVHNRFNHDEVYTEGVDYTITKSSVSTSDNLDEIDYEFKLLSTGETKLLRQTIYKNERESTPVIESFKGSHLARKVINELTGELSSTGSISFSGKVSRKDSKIYYAVTEEGQDVPTKEALIAGSSSSFIKSGSFDQTERDVNYSIDGLTLNKEYALYVLIKNDFGTSEIYSKHSISEVINITTCEEFYDMTVNIDTYKNEFRLMNDLDFSSFDWVCDSENNLKFAGILDGNNHTIKNLSIQSPYRKAAIFFEIDNATIKNLNFEDTNVSGLQDAAVICGFSNGGAIENITFTNANVNYNNIEGSEGYFALIAGRLQKGTTNMNNITVNSASISCNKYTGVLTGNVNKGTNCVLNAKNIQVYGCDFNCAGAAVGLIGRNRGTTNIENAFIRIKILFAKKEMGIIAGHNKEGGVINIKNVIGMLEVAECTQPTYFNYFIGSQDDNTSSYSYSNVYFIEGDYSSISDSIIPTTSTRTCGVTLTPPNSYSQKWWEENTFIEAFEVDSIWSYDVSTGLPYVSASTNKTISAEDVNNLINKIKGDFSSDDHYYIYKALHMYEKLTDAEKAKVEYQKLQGYRDAYLALINEINAIVEGI